MFRAGVKTGFFFGVAGALIFKIMQTTDERAWRDAQTAANTTSLLRQDELRGRLAEARSGEARDGGPER